MLTLIIDDEPDARAVLRSLIETFCPELQIVGEADSVQSAVRFLKQNTVEVLMLDIEMDDGNGFEILDCLPNGDFHIIFTTAHDSFALRAFQYYACDYLLKPIAPSELLRAFGRLKEGYYHIQSKRIYSDKEPWNTKKHDKITINTSDGITFLPLDQILRIESDGNYSTFLLTTGEKTVASRVIKDFENILPPSDFCRIHQSHIVQLSYVRKFLRDEGCFAVMTNGDVIPVSRRKKEVFLERLMAK